MHGFHTTSDGAPTDTYGRSLYIDTLELEVRAGLGARDVDRLPQADRIVLLLVLADPRRVVARQPVAAGGRTATATASASSGQGVTPDVVAETLGSRDVGPARPRRRSPVEKQQLKLFDEVTAGDKFCATQH